MTKITPQYEVLSIDLQNHSIAQFLISREFKLFMTENNLFSQWKGVFEKMESSRTYVVLGKNHESGDAFDTFKAYLNAIPGDNRIEDIVSNIISKFVENKQQKTDFSDVLQGMKVAKFRETNIQLVSECIEYHKIKELPEKEIKQVNTQKISSMNKPNTKDIFIVHGHNEGVKHNVARVVEKLKLNPIILNEQSSGGLTIIEKLEKYANVSFAIVLLTYDDFGNAKAESEKNKRARQNVIFELGYFIAKLSRNNVLCLHEDGVELPSDILGVVYVKIDDSESWKIRLTKELKAVGFNVSLDDVL